MKKILLISFLFIGFLTKAQQYTQFQGYGFKATRLWADSVSIQPNDTIRNKAARSIAVIGSSLYIADGTKWNAITGGGGGSVDTFSISTRAWRQKGIDSVAALSSVSRFDHNVVVNIPGGSLGAFSNGQTIPLNGKRVDSLPDILATKCVLPTYVAPTAGISSSPSNGSYERGTNLGTITLSSSFTQNNGGSNATTTYYQNGSPLGGNTTTISSLTSTQSFYVNKAYLQGACIADNCGAIECIGRINAGSVNSGTISFTPFDKRYWGFISSTAPSNSVILALSQDNNGNTGSLTLSNVTPSGSQYLAYFTKGSVSSVTVNGIPATGAFTFTTYSVTNAQGLTQTYTYVYSNNPQTSTLSSVIFN